MMTHKSGVSENPVFKQTKFGFSSSEEFSDEFSFENFSKEDFRDAFS